MQASLTWLDLTATDRDAMRRVLDLFAESGTVDELGLGTLRDGLSAALFPGTSSIQTRLRYFLFIPWLYADLERRRVAGRDVADRARAAELGLIPALLRSDDTDGVIGSSAGGSLKRLPSEAYWGGLVQWGLFEPGKAKGWYHRHFDAFARGLAPDTTPDDPGVRLLARRSWTAQLPEAPKGFPREASLALTRQEADFLQGQIASRCVGTLLQWLAVHGGAFEGPFWDEPGLSEAPRKVREVTELARRFSLHVEGAPLLYNRMVAAQRLAVFGHEADEAKVSSLDTRLQRWASEESEERAFDTASLWHFAASRGVRVPSGQRHFIDDWCDRVTTVGAAGVGSDAAAQRLVQQRERRLKGPRSRFDNRSRLAGWHAPVGVGRLDFRWFRVRQLLRDLHAGLGVG